MKTNKKRAEGLWTRADLAAFLNLTPGTVKVYMSCTPDRLPPRAASTEAGVRWDPEVVRAWAAEQPAPVTGVAGRPRKQPKTPRKRKT